MNNQDSILPGAIITVIGFIILFGLMIIVVKFY